MAFRPAFQFKSTAASYSAIYNGEHVYKVLSYATWGLSILQHLHKEIQHSKIPNSASK